MRCQACPSMQAGSLTKLLVQGLNLCSAAFGGLGPHCQRHTPRRRLLPLCCQATAAGGWPARCHTLRHSRPAGWVWGEVGCEVPEGERVAAMAAAAAAAAATLPPVNALRSSLPKERHGQPTLIRHPAHLLLARPAAQEAWGAAATARHAIAIDLAPSRVADRRLQDGARRGRETPCRARCCAQHGRSRTRNGRDRHCKRSRFLAACGEGGRGPLPGGSNPFQAKPSPTAAAAPMLDDWNSQLTETAEQPGLGDLAAGGGGGGAAGGGGDLFGLDHRAEYLSRRGLHGAGRSPAGRCSCGTPGMGCRWPHTLPHPAHPLHLVPAAGGAAMQWPSPSATTSCLWPPAATGCCGTTCLATAARVGAAGRAGCSGAAALPQLRSCPFAPRSAASMDDGRNPDRLLSCLPAMQWWSWRPARAPRPASAACLWTPQPAMRWSRCRRAAAGWAAWAAGRTWRPIMWTAVSLAGIGWLGWLAAGGRRVCSCICVPSGAAELRRRALKPPRCPRSFRTAHAGLRKARPLAKLKGLAVTSVAWSPSLRTNSFRCAAAAFAALLVCLLPGCSSSLLPRCVSTCRRRVLHPKPSLAGLWLVPLPPLPLLQRGAAGHGQRRHLRAERGRGQEGAAAEAARAARRGGAHCGAGAGQSAGMAAG